AIVIAKSSNKNQVNYAVTVDDACAPVGPSPVHPYWRMLERGPTATEPLTEREQRVLGLKYQEVTPGAVEVALRGMPTRVFAIHTSAGLDGRCGSWVETTIDGATTRLKSIYVQQKLFGTVDYVLLSGRTADGAVATERVTP
ncbi:MAG: DUF4833 domain-containing protein, partial [Polyangiaceae bacterium]